MNRERLTILRDHLASLPDERLDMSSYWGSHEDIDDDALDALEALPIDLTLHSCGTTACVAGWASALFSPNTPTVAVNGDLAQDLLSLTNEQAGELFWPECWSSDSQTRQDAIAAIQSMLDSPDDDALPVWPEVSL